MMRASRRKDAVARASAALERRLRRDLEARGLAAALAAPVATRIAQRAAELDGDAYGAFLDGVAAAAGARREDAGEEASAAEIQRLVQDFAIELKKLDEGLRLLSAYLLRIRDRTARERPRVVH